MKNQSPQNTPTTGLIVNADAARPAKPAQTALAAKTGEIGGPDGLEPTRYGDWERKGRVSDF